MRRVKVLTGDDNGSFSSPKPQDLMGFSRKISKGDDNGWIEEAIEKNPRILCTSSDSPSIVQEGARYNSLHIAARWGNSEAATLILSAVSSNAFMARLYPDDHEDVRSERTKYLTDMYLNTPDKHALETSLHIACKFNHYEVVKVLISHPLVDKDIKNLEGKFAKDIIGTRHEDKQISRKIRKLFQDDWIVPIWCDPNCDLQPIVGKVVNPKHLGKFTPSPFHEHFKGIDMSMYGPEDLSAIPHPVFGVQRVIRAYAGPMSYNLAKKFYQMMTHSGDHSGPSLSRSFSQSFTFKSPEPGSPTIYLQSPLLTNTNGSVVRENFGGTPKKLISQIPQTTPLCASTPKRLPRQLESASASFLDISDLLSPNLSRSRFCQQIAEDKRIRLEDPVKGLERIGRKYATELEIPFWEYWKFADKFMDLYSSEGLPLAQLESRFRKKEQLEKEQIQSEQALEAKVESPVSLLCEAFSKFNVKGDSPEIIHNSETAKSQIPDDKVRRRLRFPNFWQSSY